MIDQLVGDLRSSIVRGVVRAVNDGGQVQTVDVETSDGLVRAGIEVLQVFGHAGNPPAAGIGCILLAVGADPGNYVALPLASPVRRFGSQAAGDSTLYAADGSRVAVHNHGTIEVLAATKLVIHTPDVEVVAPSGVTITANVTITGNVLVTGTVTAEAGLASGGNATVNGSITVAGGDVTADGITLKTHRHPYSGGITGVAQE
jgi:phage baseplate assembly protein V